MQLIALRAYRERKGSATTSRFPVKELECNCIFVAWLSILGFACDHLLCPFLREDLRHIKARSMDSTINDSIPWTEIIIPVGAGFICLLALLAICLLICLAGSPYRYIERVRARERRVVQGEILPSHQMMYQISCPSGAHSVTNEATTSPCV